MNNSISKKLENKVNISKIACVGGDTGTVCFQNWEGHIITRNPFLGQWYDLHASDYESEAHPSVNPEDIKCEIQVSQMLGTISPDDRLNHQALTYVGIVEELLGASDQICSSLLPAFTALKACFSAGWKPTIFPQSILKASVMLLNNSDEILQDSGRDMLMSIIVLSPSICEQVVAFLMDDAKYRPLNQQHLSILQLCFDQIMQSSFSALLNRVVSRSSSGKPLVEKEDSSSEGKLQLGNRIQFLTCSNEWKIGSIVKINNIEGTVVIEYEDVDGNNNSVIKLESMFASEALLRIQHLTTQPGSNSSYCAPVDGDAISQNYPSSKVTILNLFNNSESISRIISLAYLQVHGSCSPVSKRDRIFECTCCASNSFPRVFVPAQCSSCSVCLISSTKSTIFAQCTNCNSMMCFSCTEKQRDRKLLITLNSQEPCPVYRTMDFSGEIITSIAPFSKIEVLDSIGSLFFQMIVDEDGGCGYVPKTLPKNSFSWETVVKIDSAESNSCEYLESLIRTLFLIDHLRKEMVLSLPSVSMEESHHLHELYSQVLESAYFLFSSNLPSIFSHSMDEQSFVDEEDDILFSHDDKSTALLRLTDSDEVSHKNILDIIAPLLPRPIEKIGIMAFGSILSLIIMSISEYADALTKDIHSTISTAAYYSYAILKVIFASEHRCILIPCFFRVMIAKCGLAAKQMVNLRKAQLSSKFSVELCMESFLCFEKLENAYVVAITHPLIRLTNSFSQGIIAKVQNTIRALGHGSLANQMVEIFYKDIFYKEDHDHPFQNCLKSHILVPYNRFSKDSKLMRKFLRELTSYCSSDCLAQLEQIWRNLLTDFAYEKMIKLYQQTCNGLFPDIFDEAINVCKGLRSILEQLRSASRVDMSIGGITYMSSEFAFENAYRRLVRDVSIQFSRAICICLSSNLDESFIQSASYKTRESIDNVMDMIDVLFHKNSTEFQHFYELLLARRLIKCRAISHVLDSNLLSELPPIMKGELMLHDIRQTVHHTSAFRSHLLSRMDRSNIILSDETIHLILQEKNFSLMLLTGSVWPAYLVSPISFANMRLPHQMQIVKEEFFRMVSPMSTLHLGNADTNTSSRKFPQAFHITGSKRNPLRINGIFFATDDIKDGWPIYVLEGNIGSILEYSSSSCCWQMKRALDQGNNSGLAYCKVEPGSSPEGSQRVWYVWEKETKMWVSDTLEVAKCAFPDSSPSNIETLNNQTSINPFISLSSSEKRYVWCHGAGSITVGVHIQRDADTLAKYCMLSMTEAQAAVVLLFNSFTLSQQLLVDDIRTAINISGDELNALLFSVSSSEFPLLVPVNLATYQFSPTYKYPGTMPLVPNISMLESLCDNENVKPNDPPTVFLPSIILNAGDSESNMNSDHLVLQGWRNDQIDACIVRLLKYTMRDKSGEFPCGESNSSDLVALSVDTLCSLIRAHFKNEGDIPIETIVKRCERLVTIGVIDKLHGNKDTLRSIVYCYTINSNPHSVVHLDTSNKTVDEKVIGIELFDHLRIVLNIKSSGMEDTGISFPLLHVKFLAWMMAAKCDLSFPPQSKSNPLESLIKLLVTLLDTMMLQVNAAKLQYLRTFSDVFRRKRLEDTFLKLPGWDELLNSIIDLSDRHDRKLPVLLLSFHFAKAFATCLPMEVLFAILNAFGKNIDIVDNVREHWNEHVADQVVDCEIIHNVQQPLEFNSHRSSILAQMDLLWHEKSLFSYDILQCLGISSDLISNMQSLLYRRRKESSESIPQETPVQAKLSQDTLTLKFPALNVGSVPQEPYSDVKPMHISLTLEEFVSAIFLQVSIRLSDSVDAHWEKMCKDVDCSFASILHHVYFNRFVDEVAKMFDIRFSFLHDYVDNDRSNEELGRQSAAAEDSQNLSSDEEDDFMNNMIPCEFCSDNVPMNIFEVHALVCRRGLHLPAPLQLARLARREGADAAFRHAGNWFRLSLENLDRPVTPTWENYQDTNEQSPSSRLKSLPETSTASILTKSRPQPDSPLALLFFQSIINNLLQVAAKQGQHKNETGAEKVMNDENCHSPISSTHSSPSFGCYSFDVTFQEIVNDLFHIFDRDKDGILTISDFTVNPTQLNALNVIDPFLLYGDKDEKIPLNTNILATPSRGCSSKRPFKVSISSSGLVSPTRSISFNTPKNEDHRATATSTSISTGIPLHKTDSLRYSLSHEKSFPKMTSSHSYSDLTEAEQEVAVFLERARNILDDSESNVLAMLLHYKWDLKTLVEDYIENSRAVRLAVGLGTKNEPPFYRYDYYLNTQSDRGKSLWDDSKEADDDCNDSHVTKGLLLETKDSNGEKEQTKTVTCGICADIVDNREAFALPCCHWYCLVCWEGYIETALNDRQLIRHCPSPDCKFLVVPDMLTYFASSELGSSVKKLIVKSFVEEKRGQRVIGSYCKNPRGCKGVVVMAEDANSSEAVCSLCATSFCAACDLPPHAPATCDMVAHWEEKGGYLETGKAEDAEARKLKHLTTKPCPKCGVRIEKNGGCPHMTCVQPNCKYQFCWECSGEYHTSSTCNRPKVKTDNNAILLFDELDRQCANYFLARKIAMKGKKDVEQLLCQVEKHRDTRVYRTIAEGWSTLADAQSALAHTCIMMYFVKSVKIVFLYEHHKLVTQQLQQKFEEEWTNLDTFPVLEARTATRDLQRRMHDYLVSIAAEVVLDRHTNQPVPPPPITSGPATARTATQQQSPSSTNPSQTPTTATNTTADLLRTPPRSLPTSPQSTTATPLASPSPLSSLNLTTSSLLPKSALLFESKKSPHRILQSARSRSGSHTFAATNTELLRRPSSSGTRGQGVDSADYDLVDRLSTFSLQEKSDLASTLFGDAFGGSRHIYRAFL